MTTSSFCQIFTKKDTNTKVLNIRCPKCWKDIWKELPISNQNLDFPLSFSCPYCSVRMKFGGPGKHEQGKR